MVRPAPGDMVAQGPVPCRVRDDARLGARVERAEGPLGVAPIELRILVSSMLGQSVLHLQCVISILWKVVGS